MLLDKNVDIFFIIIPQSTLFKLKKNGTIPNLCPVPLNNKQLRIILIKLYLQNVNIEYQILPLHDVYLLPDM
jgi:hypothetical protein